MSDFGKLLRSSRFASLAKPLSRNRSKNHPTHQVIETRAAALAKQEWGLKYALPSKVKSRYITFNDVDSLERLVDFETSGGDLWKRLRFQELGVVPKYEEGGSNPLFEKSGNGVKNSIARNTSFESLLKLDSNASSKELKSLISTLESLRPQFRAWLLKNEPQLFKSKNSATKERLLNAAVEFLREYKQKESVNKLDSLAKRSNAYSINGFGGLSYGLKGRITNSPNGYVQEKVVPARYLTQQAQTTTVAVGGFIATTNKLSSSSQFKIVSSGQTARETVVPMTVSNATIDSAGTVSININPVSIPSTKTRIDSGSRTRNKKLDSSNVLDLIEREKL